ncbi:transposable element Tcb2 transposase [Trichonephila clavipes]|nr:transposable element Tcb2 transposase [Trichonephila clavipes]
MNDDTNRTVSKRTEQRWLYRIGFGSHPPTRVPLLNARGQAAHLARAREHKDWSQDSCTSHKSRLVTGLLDEHSPEFSVINKSPSSPSLHVIKHIWAVLEQGVKGHHTGLIYLSELWTALANIWLVIPVERFQKRVESMPRHLAAVIKAIGGPNR